MTFLDPQYTEVSNQFSGVIYQRSIEGVDGNVAISPLSILTALSFLMLRASGTTLSQMKSSLKYGDIEDAIFKNNFLGLMENLDGKNRVKVENKIVKIEDDSTKPEFNEINTQIRLSNVEAINFAISVDADDSLEEDTRVFLTNSLSFNDRWKHDFYTLVRYNGDFYKNGHDATEMEFVTVEENFLYGDFKDLDATAVQLPFKFSNAALMILLPNSRTGLSALESKLHQIKFGDLTEKMSKENFFVAIPKFRIVFKRNLNGPLKMMEMGRMFSDAAEFDNLLNSTEPLKVSDVIHKFSIAITGNADRYAEFTTLSDCKSCRPKRFFVNRPFLFALIQDSTVLIMGRKVQ